jgi:guanylate kinase
MDVDTCGMTRPVLVVIGPSASGKSTSVRELDRRGVLRVHPTWTTRARRPDEVDGALEHRFVTDQVFDELETAGFFLGTVQLSGLPARYAIPRPSLADTGPVDTIMARAPFIELFAAYFPHRLVYQIEDTADRARARLVARGSDAHEIEARLAGHDAEIAAGRAIARRAFTNDGDLDGLVAAISDALAADYGLTRAARHS